MKYSQVVSGLAVARRAKDAQSKQNSEQMQESSRQSHVYIWNFPYRMARVNPPKQLPF